jgi:hypothetical protein
MLKFIMIYMYLFSLPKLSVTLFKNLSCRNIGGVSYLLSYLNEHCYNETHQKYGLFVILPVSLFIFGLIPWLLITKITSCRMLLDLDKVPKDNCNNIQGFVLVQSIQKEKSRD